FNAPSSQPTISSRAARGTALTFIETGRAFCTGVSSREHRIGQVEDAMTQNNNATVDPARQEAFAGKLFEQFCGTMSVLLASLGDRFGLFQDLAANGPTTSAELAKRTGLNERYLREWLGGLAAAGYLTYDTASQRFTLPAEHAAALAQESGPMFVGGMLQ